MKKLNYPEIEIDKELKLKQLQPLDAEKMFALIDKNREYLGKWLPFPKHIKSISDSTNFINSKLTERKNGKTYGYGIIFNDRLVGHISLMNLNGDKDGPEIGYWIAQEASGQGITTKATNALTDFALKTLKLNKIIIKAMKGNTGSNKVAEKAGYCLQTKTLTDENGKEFNLWAIAQS